MADEPASTEPRGSRRRGVDEAQLRERALSVLEAATDSERPDIRANAIEGLKDSPRRLTAAVRRGVRDENPGVRAAALTVAGLAKLQGVEEYVRPQLRNRSALVRAAAAFALARANAEADPSPIADLLRSDQLNMRAQAAVYLGELGNRSAIPMLKESTIDAVSLADTGMQTSAGVLLMRLQVAEALCKLGDAEGIHELRAALFPARPEDLEGTALAAQILGELGDRESQGQLIFLTSTTDRSSGGSLPVEIRLAAAGALAKMGIARGGTVAEEYARNSNATVRAQAAYVLGQTQAGEYLLLLDEMMDDEDEQVRVSAAAGVLASLGGR